VVLPEPESPSSATFFDNLEAKKVTVDPQDVLEQAKRYSSGHWA
jgi:hypothetical protein